MIIYALEVFSFIAASLGAVSGERIQDFRDEYTKDFTIRKVGSFHITNRRGDVRIKGWALDKVRVRVLRTVLATREEEAEVIRATADVDYVEEDDRIELNAQYGKNLSIENKLHERGEPTTQIDLEILAPSNLDLNVWAYHGRVNINGWNSDVKIRSFTGNVSLEKTSSSDIAVICPSCRIEIKNVDGKIKCFGGAGVLNLSDVSSDELYVQSETGPIELKNVTGQQIYVTTDGSIRATSIEGHIEFKTDEGHVKVVDGQGFVSGRTDTGDIHISMKRWNFFDRAILESSLGNIDLVLPPNFSGEVDVWSEKARAFLEFPLKQIRSSNVFGPHPANRLRGQIGASKKGELKIHSVLGNVRVLTGV